MLPVLVQCPNQSEILEAVPSEGHRNSGRPCPTHSALGRCWTLASQPRLEPWCPSRPQEESLHPRSSLRDCSQPRASKIYLPSEFRTQGGDGFRGISAPYTCPGEGSWNQRGENIKSPTRVGVPESYSGLAPLHSAGTSKTGPCPSLAAWHSAW